MLGEENEKLGNYIGLENRKPNRNELKNNYQITRFKESANKKWDAEKSEYIKNLVIIEQTLGCELIKDRSIGSSWGMILSCRKIKLSGNALKWALC